MPAIKHRRLIHIDAHHDMWWASDPANITIANFISRALAEDIVREVFWVVPDETWETARALRPVLRHLRKIAAEYPGTRRQIRIEKDRLSRGRAGQAGDSLSVDASAADGRERSTGH